MTRTFGGNFEFFILENFMLSEIRSHAFEGTFGTPRQCSGCIDDHASGDFLAILARSRGAQTRKKFGEITSFVALARCQALRRRNRHR
jgi:hypothetical protein